MGKKKQQQHQVQSFGSMVSKAALTQLLPNIQQMVNQLGQRLAMQQANVVEDIFTRIVALEKVLIAKNIVTQEELTTSVVNVEDEQSGLEAVNSTTTGDTVRIDVRTKPLTDAEFTSEVTKLKVGNLGSGDTLGKEIEVQLLNMNTGEIRVLRAGEKKDLDVEITLTRVSRPKAKPAQEEAPSGTDQA